MSPPQDRAGMYRRQRLRESVRLAPAGRRTPESGSKSSRAIAGRILDASPHVLVLHDADDAEVRLAMTESTTVWHAGRSSMAALQPGRSVIVRPSPDGLQAERIWVDITRVSGMITSCGRNVVEVDLGPHRGWTQVVIPQETLGRVLVRHPNLEPGYLFDVIATESPDGPLAVRPGTSQPGYPADDPPAPPPGALRSVPPVLRGTVTWFGGAGRGAAYPALDPEGDAGGCAETPVGCAVLPYLSLGSELVITNECSGRTDSVAVTECGCVAARYCDRCVQCGTSPRGRVAELSALSFVDLGGDLDAGCFNATVSVG